MINALIQTTTKLTDVLARENTALENGDVVEAKKFIQEKEEATHAYHQTILKFKEDPTLLEQAQEPLKNHLKEKFALLQEANAKNRKFLGYAIAANDYLMNAVMKRLHMDNAVISLYSAKGESCEHDSVRPKAVSIDGTY